MAERRIFPNAVVRRRQELPQQRNATDSSSSRSSRSTTDTVVLATHLGVHKLDILKTQATWWGGPVSASLYLQTREEINVFVGFLESHAAADLQQVSFHIVLEKTNLPYPHNILRNLALEYLDADFFVAADVDFIPNYGAYHDLDALLHDESPASSKVRKALLSHHLLVLPAFERFPDPGSDSVTEELLPRNKAELQVMFKEKSVIGFHMAGSPMGQ